MRSASDVLLSLRVITGKNTFPTDDATPSLRRFTLYNTMAPTQNPLGNPIPAFTEHAISVSLPNWVDNVGYEEGDPRVIDTMQTGYPRFFIHLNIRKVSICR